MRQFSKWVLTAREKAQIVRVNDGEIPINHNGIGKYCYDRGDSPAKKRSWICKGDTCEIIHKHHDEMRDDPEALSTEFIQKLVGRKC